MNSDINLASIDSVISDVILDLRYASKNNIAGKVLYPKYFEARLSMKVLNYLKQAADEFRNRGFGIVIWDAYRTPEVQEILRKYCSDIRYVAVDSNHIKGISVDITLVDKSGKYIDMGTDHDEFCEKANIDSVNLTPIQTKNRAILKNVMKSFGFNQDKYEWWHFDFDGLKANIDV